MPTDWPIIDSDLVHKIKTKFNGNPRYVEVVNKINKKSHETTESLLARSINFNEEYMEEGNEEHKEEIKKLESEIFNDVVSVFEAEEMAEMVYNYKNVLIFN